MSGLFINYRREDSAPYAGRLYDFLRKTFADRTVFMDIDAIDPGEDFVEAIDRTLLSSGIVLAVIGPSWLEVRDRHGNPRIANPDDYVYRELEAAIRTGARIIPILVGGAAMPRTDALPVPLQPISRRQAIELSDTRFTSDSERLAEAISRALAAGSNATLQAAREPRRIARETRGSSSGDEVSSDSLTTFRTLLWTSFALTIISVIVQLAKAKEGEHISLLIFDVLLLGFSAWFIIMLSRGRNWARLAYLVLCILSVPILFLPDQSGAEIALNLVGMALSLWILRAMFWSPLRAHFAGGRKKE